MGVHAPLSRRSFVFSRVAPSRVFEIWFPVFSAATVYSSTQAMGREKTGMTNILGPAQY